jgi:gamma-glutamyltranspeptidase / glutathione hydrolase
MTFPRHIFLLFLLGQLICTPLVTPAQDRLSGRSFASRSEVIAPQAMVATNHPLATQIGLDVLKQGGTAVDAAIAANAFLGLADPGMCGIGGDLFALVWDPKEKKLFGLNASGRSPADLLLRHFTSRKLNQIPVAGPLPVTVPGCVDGWFSLHQRFGKRPMAELLSPTVAYARAGIPITQETADNMEHFRKFPHAPFQDLTGFKELYMTQGRFYRKGEIFRNPQLAATLEKIGHGGRDAFYTGEIARQISAHVKKAGGFLSPADFARHTSEWVQPLTTNYRGFDVWQMPPNGQGLAVLQMLNILEGFDLSSYSYGSQEHLHLLTEAKKLAFEDLTRYYADPAFSKVPVQQLLSKEYAQERRKLIDLNKAGVYEPGLQSPSHTVYLTVADQEGYMISLIQSNAFIFGSLVAPEGLGFVLHNRGAFFELDTNHPNAYSPGKRPFHTIIPAFVTKNGQPYMSFGVMGGDMQAQGQVQILLNMVDFGMNLQEAGDAPRINHTGSFPRKGHLPTPGTIFMESGFPPETVQELLRLGHQVQANYGIFGGYQAIMFDGKVYYGASDPRKDGQAGGY